MRFAPEDKNLCNHLEELSGVCVRLLEPPGPGMNDMKHGDIEKWLTGKNIRTESSFLLARCGTCCCPRSE